MTPGRAPRWTVLLALPVLAGALLLMHGLDAGGAGASPQASVAEVAPHPHDAGGAGRGHERCTDCDGGHLVAACVGVLATIAALRAARSYRSSGGRARPLVGAGRWLSGASDLIRPPRPAWVRLAVMRC